MLPLPKNPIHLTHFALYSLVGTLAVTSLNSLNLGLDIPLGNLRNTKFRLFTKLSNEAHATRNGSTTLALLVHSTYILHESTRYTITNSLNSVKAL